MSIALSLTTQPVATGSHACFVHKGFLVADIAAMYPDFAVEAYVTQAKFTGAAQATVAIPKVDGSQIEHLFLVGLGDVSDQRHIEMLRRSVGAMVKQARGKKVQALAVHIPFAEYKEPVAYLVQQVVEILHIADYVFDDFVSKKEERASLDVLLVVDAAEEQEATQALQDGTVVASSVNNARGWINWPPSQMTPTIIANKAQELAQEHGLKCTVFDKAKILELGMGGLHAVSRGSAQEPRFVIMEYDCGNPSAPRLGYVGKGITFDSGGLSIKPANSMETMKEDMAGAASVINAITAIAQLKPDVNVVAIAALAENMTGCDAGKPGDIVRFYNGKTAEVLNTDAEGRLVLADALAYMEKHYKCDAIIDIATLTGACIYAVGPFYTALLSDRVELSEKLVAHGTCSGDHLWRLPFNDDFKKAVESKVADVKNIGNRSIAAGTITAGWFLRHFVEETPWAHLDIASTAFNVPNMPYYSPGATGSSVRLLVDVACRWKA